MTKYQPSLVDSETNAHQMMPISDLLTVTVKLIPTIKIHFKAKQVFAVMGNSTQQAINVKVLFNGVELQQNAGEVIADRISLPDERIDH